MTQMKTLNQMLTDNPNLLSFVVVPQSAQEDLDAATLKTAIIRRCGDVEPYYQKPADFSLFGTLWFNTHNFLFTHALEIWNATYNPIENYDRIEEETINGTRETSGSNTDTHSGTDRTTTSGTRDVTDTNSGTDTLTDNVTRETEIAGFNSSSYSDANKETETGSHATAHGESIAHTEQTSGSEAVAHGHVVTTDEDTTGTENFQHGHIITTGSEGTEETETARESHIHGNIGVTTAQQMLESEMELASKFWIYDYIASAFETDNFITTYNSYYDCI